MQQAARLIGYSVSKLDVGGVACMELRFDSSAGGKFQMPSAIFIQSPVVCFSVGGTGSNGFWFDCISRYCVIQWVEEHGN